MKAKYLIISLLPLLLAGCSNQEESKQYQAINDQQAIMKEYYRQHNANQSSLASYSYKKTYNYDPTYDAFGSLAPVSSTKGLYYEETLTSDVYVYSGYFINKNVGNIYTGNKKDTGSISQVEENNSFWFRNFDEGGHDGELELIKRTATKDNDLDEIVVDTKTGTAVESNNVSHYFSNNINTEYYMYFERPLVQPSTSTTKLVSAYSKSDSEIVETYRESLMLTPIENPIHPGDEYKMAVLQQTIGETTFKFIDKIGWVGVTLKETVTTSLVSDYELKLLEKPRDIIVEETNITFNYSTSIQPYSGDTFVYQQEDTNVEKYLPSMFEYSGGTHHDLNTPVKNVTHEYKKSHPEFSGYVYCFDPVVLEEGGLYSFACQEDIAGGDFEKIGFDQLKGSAGGTIVSGGVEGHNLIKTITTAQAYEFLVLVSATGTKSLVAHLYKQ